MVADPIKAWVDKNVEYNPGLNRRTERRIFYNFFHENNAFQAYLHLNFSFKTSFWITEKHSDFRINSLALMNQ